MMMLEETLPVPTPTRFVMEAIPEFSSLSEVNPFEFSFTKNFSSVLPPTPGASFLKTPDPFSIFKYITTTPIPQIFTPATPPLSEKDHADTPTDKQDKDQDGESATQAISGRDDNSISPSPPADVHISSLTNNPPQMTIKKEDPIVLDQSKLQANDSVISPSSSNKLPTRKQSMASNEWMEYERFSRAGSVDSDMSSTSSLGQKRKASMSDDLEDPEAKRKRFLERNRMAASKCRQKKKMWMQELEQRADDVQQRNKALNTLVSQLKEEVLILKSQLLSHHNCNCNMIQQYVQTSGHFMSMMNNLHTQASMSQSMNSLHHTHPLPLHPPHHSQYPCHTEHSNYPQAQHLAPSREIMYAQ